MKNFRLPALLTAWLIGIAFGAPQAIAQITYPQNGVYDQRDRAYAFTNATVYVTPERKLDKATLVIRDGKVVRVSPNGQVPTDAVAIDATGKTIYPAFIDLYTDYGMPAPEKGNTGGRQGRTPQALTKNETAVGWNDALKSQFRAGEVFTPDAKAAKALREQGFGAALTLRMDGISRGSAALVHLGEERANQMIIRGRAAHPMAFSKGSSKLENPTSLMGMIALLRQTYLDGQWYATTGKNEENNISLAAWNELQDLPQLFAVGNKLEALRADKLAKEFGKTYLLRGSGDEYQRLEALKATGAPFILPLDFPAAYDVTDPYQANNVGYDDLLHWELAPENPARLQAAGITIALTTSGLEKKGEFLKRLRQAVEHGLPEQAALAALTTTPARLVRASDQLGTLEPGKWANFLITDGDIFAEKTKIQHNWVKGVPSVFAALDAVELRPGKYTFRVSDMANQLTVTEDKKVKIGLVDSTAVEAKYSIDGPLLTLSYTPENGDGLVRLSGVIEGDTWSGRGQEASGNWVSWQAKRNAPLAPQRGEEQGPESSGDSSTTSEEKNNASEKGEMLFPFQAYGNAQVPPVETVLFRNATVWTNEADGILQNTDVLISGGKIERIGTNLKAGRATVIDATGKHLTSGIIDEHSHIAISRGVNEASQESTAEVRIGDVVDSEDVNIYRQLAGGVTASQLLHGSANPIGGQSAIIKLRWGMLPEQMKISTAPGFIKFALGENVKQSNWGDTYRVRFPQTRMGVEQVFESYFTRAAEYGRLVSSGRPYRRDLDLEALLEILNRERFISCHSYQQGEINMLMKVADRHDFTVNTFTHILEGYKVADKMREHGAAGSTFSDWWAYKFEVIDAIPYNGAIMHEQGVLTAFNSDDAEMARRLNQEAGKAVMYGGVSKEDAWKFVTLNPAKMLHLDGRMGSLKAGKDADVVLWSAEPLSIYAKAELTFVDGRRYFDRAANAEKEQRIQRERARLIQAMLDEKAGGGDTQPAKMKAKRLDHCDSIEGVEDHAHH